VAALMVTENDQIILKEAVNNRVREQTYLLTAADV